MEHGYGVLECHKFTYNGNFELGLFNGQGTQKFTDGREYVGEFKDNKKHGKGKYKSPFMMYEGTFANDKYDGKNCSLVLKEIGT